MDPFAQQVQRIENNDKVKEIVAALRLIPITDVNTRNQLNEPAQTNKAETDHLTATDTQLQAAAAETNHAAETVTRETKHQINHRAGKITPKKETSKMRYKPTFQSSRKAS